MTKLHIMIDKNKENTVDMNSGKLDFWQIDLTKGIDLKDRASNSAKQKLQAL